MADWWLIPEDLQNTLRDHLWESCDKVLSALQRHNNENGVTGALGQTLSDNPLVNDRVIVRFDYRKFAEQSEEFWTGADGALIVTITPPNGPTKRKAVLFQAKLCKKDVPARQQSLRREDASRLKRQSRQIVDFTDDAIGIFYTPDNIYVVDAQALNELTVEELRQPLRGSQRLLTLATYLGKWLPRCARGDDRSEFLERADVGNGFMHLITMDVRSHMPLLPQAKEDIPRQDYGQKSHGEKMPRRWR